MSGKKTSIGAQAFSLVELLVVIAVIMVIAAIAIPNIAGITAAATESKIRRNAQTIASTYSAAITSGMPTNSAANLSDAVAIVIAGTNITVGNTMHSYSVDGLTPAESTNAQAYLRFSNGMIVYQVP